MTTTEYRAAVTIAKNEVRASQIARATALKEKGYTNVKIGEKMDLAESTVRGLLEPGAKDRVDALTATANKLKEEVEKKGMIDVGAHVERHLGVSRERLKTAVAMLKEEGYVEHKVSTPQLGTDHNTNLKVLAKPGTKYSEVWNNIDNIEQPYAYSDDNGRTFNDLGNVRPKKVDLNRVAINYDEDGGTAADGVIYVRPGVEDLTLGNSRYAQVRINVNDTHYLKGMAVYKDDLPDGVDLLFNTNKKKADLGSDPLAAMKKMETDKDGTRS